MQTYRARPLDATKILTRRELAAVLNDLKRKAPRSKNTRLNLALFRLIGQIVVETRPHVQIDRLQFDED